MKFKTILEAEKYIGGLSSPGKMPCYSFSIPATECHVGKRLNKIKGSVCSVCYALKGRYSFPNVKNALANRFKKLNNKYWVEAISFILNYRKEKYFRWHDSGDLQSVEHLHKICQIAINCPQCKFWLPTREYKFVKQYIEAGNIIPNNLCIRLSSLMIDGPPPVQLANSLNIQVSGVSKNQDFSCPAPYQNNQCQKCRSCWDKQIFNINYKKH